MSTATCASTVTSSNLILSSTDGAPEPSRSERLSCSLVRDRVVWLGVSRSASVLQVAGEVRTVATLASRTGGTYARCVRGRSKLWLLSAALIAAGAALEAAAVMLYWRPCAGSMLNGSVLRGYRYESEFTAECLAAMDRAPMFVLPQPGSGWTLMGSLGATAGLLLAAAWLVLLPALRLPRIVTLTAALPVLLGIALVIDSAVMSLTPETADDELGRSLAVLIEVSALLALVAIAAAGVAERLLARSAIVLLAATSTGLFHQIAEYIVAIAFSDANWDAPPGSGYFTVVTCLLAAIATTLFWWLDNRTPGEPVRKINLTRRRVVVVHAPVVSAPARS